MDYSLKFLYSRLKTEQLSKEEAQNKVCQEVLIAKIGSNKDISSKVSFKGGLIIDSLAKGKRGYTKDIDFDLIKYPLSEQGLSTFINKINDEPIFGNIIISIKETKELRHKNYHGRRVVLSFNDNESTFNMMIDIGIFTPLIKRVLKYEYNIRFGGKASIYINPVERMIADKLSTFAIYLNDNTRSKDLFDAYYLITNIHHDKELVIKMLETLLVKKNKFYKNIHYAISSIINTLTDKNYLRIIEKDQRNWVGTDSNTVIETIIEYLGK